MTRANPDMLSSEKEDPKFVAIQKKSTIEEAIRQILTNVGEDPNRSGLIKTPHRVAKMFDELLEGYSQDLKTIVNGALYDNDFGHNEMVVVEDIEYSSMCEHHMLPFTGRAHIAYIPRDKIIGLSKIPRIVDMFSKRLQVQERLTNQIADAVEQVIDPFGVMIVLEGKHMCASLRGVKKQTASMKTLAYRGDFQENKDLREEFFKLIERAGSSGNNR
ncbi:MAG: GTP cyclohydrolase I FolE [Candidatus Kariarchaeaceae archaeon]